MEKPCLNNPDEYPDDAVLDRHLEETGNVWDAFIKLLKEDYPSISGEWRYYNDGKNWLFKVTKKKKTVCWVAVHSRMFKTAFYFSDRAEDLIIKSKLKKEYIDQFASGKRYGKIRGIIVEVRKPADLKTVRELIEIKEQLK